MAIDPMSSFDLAALGVLAAALSVVAFVPYVYDMLRGRTLPHRATWLIWSVLSGMSLLANIQEGAEASLAYVASQTGVTVIIFLASLCCGTGSMLRRGDCMVLWLAGIGIALWLMMDDAMFMLVIALSVSALGGLLTVEKAYRAPTSETSICWTLSAIAACLALLAANTTDIMIVAYPAYLLVLYTGILLAMGLGKRQRRIAPAPACSRTGPMAALRPRRR